MDEYAGRVLAERYRLPLRPLGDDDFTESRAFDTFSGQEVLVRQVPLPEVVDAEVVGAEPAGPAERGTGAGRYGPARLTAGAGVADRSPRDPAVRRALEAATTAAQLADHPRLEQVFDVFAQDGSLWIVAELLLARPLSALLAERTLSPHRAAEIAADLLTVLRVLHAEGRLHRNITAHTVLVCDDGRAILTGLAAGAAQEALCGTEPSATGDPQDGSAPDAPAARTSLPDQVSPTDKTSLTKPAPDEDTTGPAYGRPTAGLAAERARQARLTVVGPLTERWAPEQAGPVHENWQLAPPVGPATDLWAVGALLYRSVQGQPPFPEDSAVELAQLVCSQPPADAEECGALRPVVESLLRQDPADRPDAEELSGWLRSLIRTAPEPAVGSRLVTMPAEGADPRRLPIVRRRGELVRKGRHKKTRTARRTRPRPAPAAVGAAAAAPPVPQAPAPEQPTPLVSTTRPPRPPKQPKPLRQSRPARPGKPAPPPGRGGPADRDPYDQQMPDGSGPDAAPRPPRGPRHLGRLLLTAILLLLVGAVVYAMAFLPKSGPDSKAGERGADRTGSSGAAPADPAPSGDQEGDRASAGTGAPQTTEPAEVAKGFAVRSDPEGFQVAVREGWQRRGANDQGQVRYVGGDYELVVVPGRDTTARFGTDPMAYLQNKEAELAPYRSSGWASASGLQRIDVGKTAMAEGTFSWRDASGREVYVRNLAMIHKGRYHLVLVIGPDRGRHEIDQLYTQATSAYRPG